MKVHTLLTHLILFIAVSLPLNAWSRDFPIVLKESNQSTPPLHGTNYSLIGYWDVDDPEGNENDRIRPPIGWSRVFTAVNRCSYGTFIPSSIKAVGGCYMASLGIDHNNLDEITDLRMTASNDSPKKILDRYPFKTGAVHHPDQSKMSYLVGVWDVDGGGGYGNDGSTGKYGMTLEAEFGNADSQRKLLDLILVASNKKGPKTLRGYDIIGYWDVDRGGSRGTNGSTGKYMLTLLAKWNK